MTRCRFILRPFGSQLTAVVLYPVAGILMSPIFAGAAMALGSVSVVSNSLRVRRVRAPAGA